MKHEPKPIPTYPYLLSEESHLQLHDIRDNLRFVALLTEASTQKEEDEPLLVPRSMLSESFEHFAQRLDQVLDSVEIVRSIRCGKAEPL